MKRAEQTGDSVKVVAVKVSDEDRMDATAFHGRTHELNLRTFAAVEQEHVALTHKSCRRQSPRQRRYCGAGSEQNNTHNETKDCTTGTWPSGHNPPNVDSRGDGVPNRHTNPAHKEC